MRKCDVEDCNRKHHAKGLCREHYNNSNPAIERRLGAHSRTYHIWYSMKHRCTNPRSQHFAYYGGRGIKVCARWLADKGFANFLSDMGYAPEGLTLDRIDNSRGYSPDNCRWVGWKVQALNRRPRSCRRIV